MITSEEYVLQIDIREREQFPPATTLEVPVPQLLSVKAGAVGASHRAQQHHQKSALQTHRLNPPS